MATGLTETAIKAAKPKEKRYTMFDTGGLYIEIAPTGGKWWRFRYKGNGKNRVLSLGTYPDISLKSARVKRDELRTCIASGKPIGSVREPQVVQVPAALRTFQSVAEEWLAFKKSNWAHNTYTMACGDVRQLQSVTQAKDVKDLDVQDFLPVFRAQEAQGHFSYVHHIAGTAVQILHYARLSGYTKYNVLNEIHELLQPAKTKHFRTITDTAEIGKLLQAIEAKKGYTSSFAALRIMPYVFVRSTELRNARWEEIDFDNAVWKIPAERMKMRRDHIVPLARQVVEFFKIQRGAVGSSVSVCFPGIHRDNGVSSLALRKALYSMGFKHMTIHGFRSLASTLLNEQGYRPDIIEAQLAHVDKNRIRAAYNRAQYLDERREMMQDWADYLDKLRSEATA